MTLTQKILAAKCGKSEVSEGELVECAADLVFGNEVVTPLAITEFNKMGVREVFDRNKIVLVPDHFVPNKDIASAELAKTMREFALSKGITHYFEVGRGGIEHALIPEKGFVSPGYVVVGADSHTTTHGALGAFATGFGSTDMAYAMAFGKVWLRIPQAIKVIIIGQKRPFVSGKDIILHLIGILGVDGARYQSIEFSGEISRLSICDRFTIANMAVEAGAKNAIFPADSLCNEFVMEHGGSNGMVYSADSCAKYTMEIALNLDDIPLTVAFPHLPENVKSAEEAEAMKISVDQVVIGSCTNGWIDDMRVAAAIMKGKTIAANLRCIVIPATQLIWKQCIAEGLMDIFTDAGAIVCCPTCGPCLGAHSGVLAQGEVCVSTTNRNFTGRMGHKTSEIYLASPVVAAASAIAGYICKPPEI